MKTKIEYLVDKVTDFYVEKIPKVDSNHTCLAVISLDSALKKDESFYLQVFLKECKYIMKKVIRYINDNLSDVSSDESEEELIFLDEYLNWLLLVELSLTHKYS